MKKVAIVGFASSSREMAPFNDDSFEIWTMNHAPITWCPKWSRLFEMHTLEHLRSVAAHGEDPNRYLGWLAKQEKPIYMQERTLEFPSSVALPIAEMDEWLRRVNPKDGHNSAGYWTSTISFMLGLALLEEFEVIHVYGIDLLQEDEYVYQRSGAEYLIGLARGLGREVYIPRQAALCKANYVYGYTKDPEGIQTKINEKAVLDEVMTELDKGTDLREYVRARLAETERRSSSENAKILKGLVDYIEDKAKLSESLVVKARMDASSYNGAMQMANLVLQEIEKGGDVKKFAEAKRAELQQKFTAAHETAINVDGQTAAFKTAVVWGRHYSRGGSLNL